MKLLMSLDRRVHQWKEANMLLIGGDGSMDDFLEDGDLEEGLLEYQYKHRKKIYYTVVLLGVKNRKMKVRKSMNPNAGDEGSVIIHVTFVDLEVLHMETDRNDLMRKNMTLMKIALEVEVHNMDRNKASILTVLLVVFIHEILTTEDLGKFVVTLKVVRVVVI
ncbi:uncharacterized protein LOC143227820 [Tachypleus tridentatus]|uniref:uncharacterized protein LOC143227820 n=1 Tax=Tachypleus tridentatus TaxID=6853 RepID=UPI003FD41234